MAKPWMIMALSAATERAKDLQELVKKFDIVVVDDHDFAEAVILLDELKRRKLKEAIDEG